MKNIITFLFLMFLPVFALAQTEKLDAIFEKYQEAEGVTSIKIAKPMFRLLNNINIDDSDMDKIKPLISKMNGLKILIMEKPEKAENPTAAQLAAINEASKVKNEILAAVKNLAVGIFSACNSGHGAPIDTLKDIFGICGHSFFLAVQQSVQIHTERLGICTVYF